MIDSDTKTCHPKRKTRSIIIFKAEIEKKNGINIINVLKSKSIVFLFKMTCMYIVELFKCV